MTESDRQESPPEGSPSPPSRKPPSPKRKATRWIVGGLLFVVALLVVLAISFPRSFSNTAWKLYLAVQGDAATDAERRSVSDLELESEFNPLLLATALSGQPVSLSTDGSTFHMQFSLTDLESPSGSDTYHSLWSIDLESGEYLPIHSGNLVSAIGWGNSIVYTENPARSGSRNFVSKWFPPYYRMLHYTTDGTTTQIDEGSLHTRWILPSPDGHRIVYEFRNNQGLQTALFDLESGEKQILATGKDGDVSQWPDDAEGFAVAWLDGGASLLRILLSPITSGPHKDNYSLWRLQVCSATTGQAIQGLPGFRDRVFERGPSVNGHNHFFLSTFDRDQPFPRGNEQIDIFQIEPLRWVKSIRGVELHWSPDGRMGLIEKRQRENLGIDSEILVFRTDDESITPLDLQELTPPFQGLAYQGHPVLGVFSRVISPDSRYAILAYNTQGRFGLLDLERLDVALVVQGWRAGDFLWSPDGRYLAFRGEPVANLQAASISCILDIQNQTIQKLEATESSPVVWIDPSRCLWINRWSIQDQEKGIPLEIAISDVRTTETRILPIR